MDLWAEFVNDQAPALADTHLPMTLAGAVGEKKFGRILEGQHAYSEGAKSTNSNIIEYLGRELCLGMIAFHRGDFAVTERRIGVVRDQIYRIGRSNAQRDLFQITLNAARDISAANPFIGGCFFVFGLCSTFTVAAIKFCKQRLRSISGSRWAARFRNRNSASNYVSATIENSS